VLLQWDRIDDGTRRDLLRRASENADELTRLITQLLDFTRIEGDLPPLDVRPQPLRATIGRIVDGMGAALERHDIDVHVDSGLWVTGDGDAMSHVVSNILGNAAKFAPAGTTISISAEPVAGDEVVVSIRDQGPGIPPEELDRVFERFHQVTERRGASRKGAGLGLAIARRYVELQDGRIWVESRVGEGATFHFTLPAARSVPNGESAPSRPGLTRGDAAPRIDQPVSPA
jgi:signal transduction histidine kinase